MNVFVPKETHLGETRAALAPEHVGPLVRAGLVPIVEQGLGEAAGFPDEAYLKAGAAVRPHDAAPPDAHIVLRVRPEEMALRKGNPVHPVHPCLNDQFQTTTFPTRQTMFSAIPSR